MLARIFGPDHDQVLVHRDNNEDGAPSIVFVKEFNSDGGVIQIEIGFHDTDEGWSTQERMLEEMTESVAREIFVDFMPND